MPCDLSPRDASATVGVARPRRSLTRRALQESLLLIRIETLPFTLYRKNTIVETFRTVNMNKCTQPCHAEFDPDHSLVWFLGQYSVPLEINIQKLPTRAALTGC